MRTLLSRASVVLLLLAVSFVKFAAVGQSSSQNGVEARLVPIKKTISDGTVTLTAQVKLVNRTAAAVKNVTAAATVNAPARIDPDRVTVEQIGPNASAVASSIVTLTAPVPAQQDANTNDGLKWEVTYTDAGGKAVSGLFAASAPPSVSSDPAVPGRTGFRLSEIMFHPANPETDPQWIECYNDSDQAVPVGGYELCNAEGSIYVFPGSLPPVPARAFVLVLLDGQGAAGDDLSFEGDNLATLHTPDKGGFDAAGDQCALHSGAKDLQTALRGFISWGVISPVKGDARAQKATTAVQNAAARGLWQEGVVSMAARALTQDLPKGPVADVPAGASVGVMPGAPKLDSTAWAVYAENDATPGAANPIPAPVACFPENAVATLNQAPIFSWLPLPCAQTYHLQIARDEAMEDVAIDAPGLSEASFRPAEALATPATYYWRVRALDSQGSAGAWSKARNLTIGDPLPQSSDSQEVGGLQEDAAAPFIEAAGATVSGQVTDTRTANGFAGVNIALTGTANFNAVTIADGTWSVNGVTSGPYTVTASIAHYPNAATPINVIGDLPGVNLAMTGASKAIGVGALGARKDSSLLCLDGCEKTDANNRQWDGSHEALAHWWDHEKMYCPYTAIKMINSFYGGSVKRDEVAYKMKAVDANPKGDLSHGTGANDDETKIGLSWGLDDTAVANLNYLRVRPTDDEAAALINANRPLMFSTPHHWMVIDGYEFRDGKAWARFLNVDNDAGIEYRLLSTHAFDSYFAPTSPSVGRATNATVASDGDGDGIMDFDEGGRFPTLTDDQDSDADDVPDKREIESYTFRAGVNPDVDGDGLRAEVDEDSDDGGLKDGEEDLDFDGLYEPADKETDPFNKNDDEGKILDVIFCIDTTGSMGDDIDAVKASATEIITRMTSDVPKLRIAVVDYRDFPVAPYGGSGDYPFHDDLAFSEDGNAAIAAIQGLSLGWGNDWEESVYSAVIHCLDADTLGGWRTEKNVKRIIITMGDAPPHDPEPFTGYTMWDVIARAIWNGVVVEGKRDGHPVLGAIESRGAVSLYPIVIGGDSTALAYFQGMADGTGGKVFTAYSSSDVVAAVMEAVDEAVNSPFVDAGGPYEGVTSSTIVFNAGNSYDPNGNIVKYEWDWNSDGAYDEETTVPVAQHVWPSEYSGFVRVRATDNDGQTGVDTAPVEVFAPVKWSEYKVRYTHNGRTVVNPSDIMTTKGITIINGAAADKLLITKANSKGTLSNAMHAVVSNTGLKKVTIDGEVRLVQAQGELGSLTINKGYARTVIASAIGSVKMTNTSGGAASTTIVSDSTGPMANIQLTGVVLENFSLAQQDVRGISVSSKKTRNGPSKTPTLSLGGIGSYDEIMATSQSLSAAAPLQAMARLGGVKASRVGAVAIRSISVSGAPIVPDKIEANAAAVSAKGALFTLDAASVIMPGDIRMALLQTGAPSLRLSAGAGDLVIATVAADGKVSSLNASHGKYKVGDTQRYVGGHVGFPGDYSRLWVGAGINPDYKADIQSIRGTLGVCGSFMAGATYADSKLTQTYRGNISSITTLKPSPKLPESPVITGYGYVEDGTKLQKKLDKQGNATGFYLYDAAP